MQNAAVLGGADWSGSAKHAWNETVTSYLTWGKAFGGKRGRPWDKEHARNIGDRLAEWKKALNADNLSQITRPAVEKTLANLQEQYAPATLCRRYEAIRAFVTWCKENKYFAHDPLEGMRKPNADPEEERRAMTQDEFLRMMLAAPPHRRLLYDVAVDTGLRADELRQLEVGDLDAKRGGIRLKAHIDKARKDRFILLSPDLCERLKKSVEGKESNAKLLNVPVNTAREFDKDCRRAKPIVEKVTHEGKLDFHALRTAAITWFEETGAPDAHVRVFGRHATSKASNAYRRTKEDDMRALKAKGRSALQAKLDAIHSSPWSPSSSPAQDVRFSALPPSTSDQLNLANEIGQLVYGYLQAKPTMRQHVLALLAMKPDARD